MTAAEQVRPGVDAGRLLTHLTRLAAIGATPEGGVTRLAFSPEDVAGRAYVAGLMREAGLAVRVDAAGNLIGARPGTAPGTGTLVLGSHLDTVVNGGALDGAYGVLAAVEVARTLAGHDLAHDLAVVAFCDEEGGHGTMGMLGAHGFAGALPPGIAKTQDERGVPIRDLLAAVGGDAARLAGAAWPPGEIAAYLELHIEQGDVLERRGVPIGVVDSIAGRVNVAVTVEGAAGHAGTTPMDHRADALAAAARVVLAVRAIAAEERVVLRATTGTCAVEPGMWNVIPGRVRLGVEFRDVTAGRLDGALARLSAVAAEIAAACGVSIAVEPGARTTPVDCDPRLRDLVAEAAGARGLDWHRLPSGAGHDAQIVARVAPIGMIFVPSRGGISHAPGEHTAPHHLVWGADVLLGAVLRFDGGGIARR
ncbi:N-carbamoyl-L-amino acid hydrolase [Nonomuraea coxensis DSM 45129]|uniref:N-carbamoyl-L-amino acid hydrolase n=1 Tax=Nonomuraea coxensis DSM 45129 TaxID=1122611 RepID=A0ABX8U298_9ACTN|nr:Zn-dependent hydrolase [Nonomuraea coxensis]QYC41591.1 N-carbamoyl-L-amino acid hydrolase [Nonomuraea coxensis DSM 45129]